MNSRAAEATTYTATYTETYAAERKGRSEPGELRVMGCGGA